MHALSICSVDIFVVRSHAAQASYVNIRFQEAINVSPPWVCTWQSTRGLRNNFLRLSQLGLWYCTRSRIWTILEKKQIYKRKRKQSCKHNYFRQKILRANFMHSLKYIVLGNVRGFSGWNGSRRPPHPFVLLVLKIRTMNSTHSLGQEAELTAEV